MASPPRTLSTGATSLGGTSRLTYAGVASTVYPLLTGPRTVAPARGVSLAGGWGIALAFAHPGVPGLLLAIGSSSGVQKSRCCYNHRLCSLRWPRLAERTRSLRLRAVSIGSASRSGVVDRGWRVLHRARLLWVIAPPMMMTFWPVPSRCLSPGLRRLAPWRTRPFQGEFLTSRSGLAVGRMTCDVLWPSPC